MRYPFDKVYRVSCPFGWREHPITHKRQFHNGIDIAAPVGTPVRAPFECIVLRVWYDDLNGHAIRVIMSDPPYNYRASFAHLKEPLVHEGEIVPEGGVIAYSGNTGRSTGPHLHFGIASCKWSWVDPERHI